MIKIEILKLQGIDETGDVAYNLTCFDEVCAEIEIKTMICRGSWPELSKSIESALEMMFQETE